MDMLVEQRVVVEIKCVEKATELHKAQLLTYLRLANKRVCLLINFNALILKTGITRVVF